jgi:hypothetical protein
VTTYISGPDRGKTRHIRKAGGILLERQPSHLAPTGVYICVFLNGPSESAPIIDTEADLAEYTRMGDTRPKEWLHADSGTLKKLISEPV